MRSGIIAVIVLTAFLCIAVAFAAQQWLTVAPDETSGAAVTATSPVQTAPAGAVNVRCPISDNEIEAAKVSENLTRRFKGQKVGFCCPKCSQAWDKLTDAEKQAELDASK